MLLLRVSTHFHAETCFQIYFQLNLTKIIDQYSRLSLVWMKSDDPALPHYRN